MRCVTFSVAAGLFALALAPGVPARGLSLDEALARAAQHRPEIAAVRQETLAGEGRVRQASVAPAVELELEVENRSVFEESSVGLSFLTERGGKQEARVAAARAELDLATVRAEVGRLEVGREVRSAYMAALAAEQSLALSEEARSLARSFAETVTEKVRAGAASPIEQTRASVRLHAAGAEVERSRGAVALARAALALAVGDPAVRTEALEGRLPEEASLPGAAAGEDPGTVSPDERVLEREVQLRGSILAQERTQSSLDVTWRLAASFNREDEEAWLTFGVSIPLQAQGRNSGALAAAVADVERARLEQAAARQRRAGELEQARIRLASSAREAAVLRDEVLAGAAQALATVQEGYRLGKFPYLDVLDASQVLLEARLQYTAALAALAEARIEVDRLLGATGVPAITVSSR